MSTKMVMELIFLHMHLISHEKNQVDITFTNIFGKSFLNSQFSFTSLYIAQT